MADIRSGVPRPARPSWEEPVFDFIDQWENGPLRHRDPKDVIALGGNLVIQLRRMGVIADLGEVQYVLGDRDAAMQFSAMPMQPTFYPKLVSIDPVSKEQKPYWLCMSFGKDEINRHFAAHQIDPAENLAKLHTDTGFLTYNPIILN